LTVLVSYSPSVSSIPKVAVLIDESFFSALPRFSNLGRAIRQRCDSLYLLPHRVIEMTRPANNAAIFAPDGSTNYPWW
jgi:hypothetical protein